MFADGFWTGFGLGMVGGGAICWMFKDTLRAWWMGAEAFAAKLQATAAALKK